MLRSKEMILLDEIKMVDDGRDLNLQTKFDLTFNCFHICGLFLFFAFHCKIQGKMLMQLGH